jgi:hypothetical protein
MGPQLVSAAYLWVDTENRIALYSAAGHPPLLHCREGELHRVESNGLLLGVLPESEYPLYDWPSSQVTVSCFIVTASMSPKMRSAIPLASLSLNKSFVTISRVHPLSCWINCSRRFVNGNPLPWLSTTTLL